MPNRICACITAVAVAVFWCIPPAALAETDATDSTSVALESLRLRVQELEIRLAAMNAAMGNVPDNSYGQNEEEMIAGRAGATFLPRDERPDDGTTPVENSPAVPQAGQLLSNDALEVSGFFDGVYRADLKDSRRNDAALNQIELDLVRPLGKWAEAALSLCYDEEFVIGAATMSYALHQAEENVEGPAPFLSEWTASAGQFDVPFGLDYEMYCSIDRPTVTSPAVVEATHDSWNDLGFLTKVSTRLGTVDAFVVKGYGYEVWDSEEELTGDVEADDERWLQVTPDVAAGARLSVAVLPGIEWGTSLARGWAAHGQAALSLGGVHARAQYGGFSLKAEGITSREAENIAPHSAEGYYVEAQQSIGRMYGIARFDQAADDVYGVERYWSMGAGVALLEGLLTRGEFRWDATDKAGQLFFQIAARF